MTTAIVFAYHDVGVRCLKVLLNAGVSVPLVFTHADDANENIWFGSVASLARERGIPMVLGVLDATRRIPDGSTVAVDGVAGVVRWMN